MSSRKRLTELDLSGNELTDVLNTASLPSLTRLCLGMRAHQYHLAIATNQS